MCNMRHRTIFFKKKFKIKIKMNPLIYIGIALIVVGVVYFFWLRRLKTLEGTIDKLESSIIDTDDVNFMINEAITKHFQNTVKKHLDENFKTPSSFFQKTSPEVISKNLEKKTPEIFNIKNKKSSPSVFQKNSPSVFQKTSDSVLQKTSPSVLQKNSPDLISKKIRKSSPVESKTNKVFEKTPPSVEKTSQSLEKTSQSLEKTSPNLEASVEKTSEDFDLDIPDMSISEDITIDDDPRNRQVFTTMFIQKSKKPSSVVFFEE